jgi:hypothetical protein
MDSKLVSETLTSLRGTSRRQALKTLGTGALGLAGLRLLTGSAQAADFGNSVSTSDTDILQFALNLEYLEAEYYLYATTGAGLSATDTAGPGFGATTIKSNPKTPFPTPAFGEYAREIAADEKHHVQYLRSTLTSLGIVPVGKPAINLESSFNTAAQAAGIGSSFDPFASQANFILGAFVFEDVGVTAYHGAAGLLMDSGLITAAAGVLAVEAYHASNIRTTIFSQLGASAIGIAQKISNLRDTLDGAGDDDQGVTFNSLPTGAANIVPTDSNGLAFARTTRQVLNIVYGAMGASSGLFFPNGMNGAIH